MLLHDMNVADAGENENLKLEPVSVSSVFEKPHFSVELDVVEFANMVDLDFAEEMALSIEQAFGKSSSGCGRKRSRSSHSQVLATDNPEPKRSRKGRVRFCRKAKSHDGLAPENQAFDDLIWGMFASQRRFTVKSLLTLVQYTCKTGKGRTRHVLSEATLLEYFSSRLSELHKEIHRCEILVPVLPRGGGKCSKLGSCHIPGLAELQRLVEEATEQLRRQQRDAEEEGKGYPCLASPDSVSQVI